MSKINLNDVMTLRRKSGLGVMECKAALEKANGDMAIAEIDNTVLWKLCLHVASADPAPLCVNDADVPDDVLANEREIAKAQAANSGKPDKIVDQMVDGKIAKFLDGVVLLRQPFVMDGDKRIKDLLPSDVTIKRFVEYTVGS